MAQPPSQLFPAAAAASSAALPLLSSPQTSNSAIPPPTTTTAAPAPTSPSHARKHSTSSSDTVPLEHPSRAHPIHDALPNISLLPEAASVATNINPLTLQPFTPAELAASKYDELLERFTSQPGQGSERAVNTAQLAAEQEELARQIQARMDERTRKEVEIDKEIDEMEKIREVERKIWRRRMGGKDGGG